MEHKFKAGDKVKLKSNWNTIGNYHSYEHADIDKIYKVDYNGDYKFDDVESSDVVKISELYPGWIPAEVFEKVKESKSLVGRYLKALVDEPNGTSYSKGEYIPITMDNGKGNVSCEKRYDFGQENYNWKDSSVELMPEGFIPPAPIEKWIPQVGDWVRVINDGYISHKPDKDPIFQIESITNENKLHSKKTGRSGWIGSEHVVKALPHEIPAPSLSIPIEEGKDPIYVDDVVPEEDNVCESCNGEGEIMVAKLLSSGHHEDWDTCPDCKGEGIVDKPKEVMNTYGLSIGDTLPQNTIREWVNKDINYYSDHKWLKKEGSFSGDRKILQFDIMEGIPAFRISGTSDVWARCEGFLEFKNSFEKPKSSFILPEKWCVKGTNRIGKLSEKNPELFELIERSKYPFGTDGVGFCDTYYYYPDRGRLSYESFIPTGYTEITFDQFKEHVLNKPNEPVKKMSLSELFDKAKKEYPVGSTFYDLVHKAPFVVASHNFDTFGNDNQLYVPVKPRPGFSNKTARLYKDGIWAKRADNPAIKSRVRWKVGDEVTFLNNLTYYYSEDGSVEKGSVHLQESSYTVAEISTKHPDLIRFAGDIDIWYMENDFKLKKSYNPVYRAGVDPWAGDGLRQVEYNPLTDRDISSMMAMQAYSMSDIMNRYGVYGSVKEGKSISFAQKMMEGINIPNDVELKTKSIKTKLNTHVDRTDVELPELKQKSKSIKF